MRCHCLAAVSSVYRSSAMKKIMITSAFAVLLLATLAAQQLAAAAPARAAGISCVGVREYLSPCVRFLQGDAGQPSARCCQGVKSIFDVADTAAERQATCKCLKSAFNLVDADLHATQTLTGYCNLPSSYTISLKTDCSKIE